MQKQEFTCMFDRVYIADQCHICVLVRAYNSIHVHLFKNQRNWRKALILGDDCQLQFKNSYVVTCCIMLASSYFCTQGDVSLMDHLQGKRQWAENRFLSLRQANDLLDDDGIVERIFNSLTGQYDTRLGLSRFIRVQIHTKNQSSIWYHDIVHLHMYATYLSMSLLFAHGLDSHTVADHQILQYYK